MIDWFTVIAQIINFLILIGLLKYFLYGRIMKAIGDREKHLLDQHTQAEQNLEQTRSELQLAREKNIEMDKERERLMVAVREEVEVFRKLQHDQARADIGSIQARWSESVRQEKDAFLKELHKRVSESVCAIAKKALADLAGATLESQIVSRFLIMVKTMDRAARESLVDSLSAVNQAVVVQTTHELSDQMKMSLVQELEQDLNVKLDVHYEITDDLDCGIAMQVNSHKLGWNLRDYLLAIDEDLQKMIEESAGMIAPRQKETVASQGHPHEI